MTKFHWLTLPKNYKTRVVPMNAILHKALKNYHERLGEPETGPVLINSCGRRVKSGPLGDGYWTKAKKEARLSDQGLTFHAIDQERRQPTSVGLEFPGWRPRSGRRRRWAQASGEHGNVLWPVSLQPCA